MPGFDHTPRRGRGRRRLQPMSEINVTPFVDVMLVLLIIFMVAAPMLSTGVPVELPQSAAGAMDEPAGPPLTVTLRDDGGVMIGEDEVSRDSLVTRIEEVTGGNPERIFLRAPAAASYADVMQLMGALNAGGFTDIGLVTAPGGPDLRGQ
ncbi:ExbD/TolR family protein [Paracoccaceae bacterium GXU_MW_L88]